MTRPEPTLPNPYEPMPGTGGQWLDTIAQGMAAIFLLVMFCMWLASRAPS